jgi:CBS domain-containing protein
MASRACPSSTPRAVAPLGRAAEGELGAALRSSVHPAAGALLTAGVLADRDAPQLPPAAPLEAVVNAVETASGHLALVVDVDGRLRGMVDEHILLRRALPGAATAGGTALGRFFARALGGSGAALRTAGDARLTAGALMTTPPPTVAEDLPVADALSRMIEANRYDCVVVSEPDGRPIGVLWRHVALRALAGG